MAFQDAAFGKLGVKCTTFVLKQWAPGFMARRSPRLRHLAVRDRVETLNGAKVIFSHYLHVPVRYSLEQCVRSMTRRAIRLIEAHGLQFDLVHGQSIYPAALAAHRLAALFGVPFVITLRDDLSHLATLYERRNARALFEPMFAAVAAVFVIGPAQERDAWRFLPERSTAQVVLAPNGVDVQGIRSILEALPPGAPGAWGRVVSVGSLFRLKGIHENLRALKMVHDRGLRDWTYTVVGDGPYRKELEGLSKELGLKDRVAFEGSVPHHEAIRHMRDSDIMSLPSWAESFGNVYAEAAVCGRPAIGCRGGGAELTIVDKRTGLLVPPRDIPALADALAFLLSDPEKAREMGAAARGHIRQFTWERTARIYVEKLNDILAKR